MQHKILPLLLMMFCLPAFGETPDLQAHLRTGLVSGSFAGSSATETVSGDFSSPTSMDAEFEYFLSTVSAVFNRLTLVADSSSGSLSYLYMGVGYKKYLFSNGRTLENLSGDFSYSIVPTWRYYVQGEVGLSEVEVERVTSTLETTATLLEFGGSAGVIRQMSSNFGLEGNFGVSNGLPISSVSVNSLVIRAMVGLTFFF